MAFVEGTRVHQPELGLSIVPLAGELDAAAADRVLRLCDVELGFDDTAALVIDLAGVSSVESEAVDALVRIRDAAQDHDVDFSVHNAAGDDVREPLEQAGLEPSFGFPRTSSEYEPRH